MKRIAVDIGGTFTDIVYIDEEDMEILTDKVRSTPKDIAWAVFEAVKKIKTYTSSGFPHQPDRQCTLAIGGYDKRSPYSYFGRRFFYYTKTDKEFNTCYCVVLENGKEI